MKILLLSDMHHRSNDYMINYQLKFFERLRNIITKHAVDTIIIAGDINNERTVVDVMTQNIFRKEYSKLKDMVVNMKVIAGNHDCYHTTSNEQNSLRLIFPFLKDEDIIDMKPQRFKNLVLVPWINDSNKALMSRFISKYNKQENFMIGHFEFSGMSMNGGHLCDKSQLFKSDYSRFKKIYSGHFHGYQKQGNITYIGNPYQKDFSELERKFVTIFDSITGEETVIENSDTIFHKITIEPKLTDEEIQSNFSGVEGKYVKLHINSEDTNYIDKVERLLDVSKPHWVNTTTKSADTIDISEVQIDQDEREVCVDFLNMLSYENNEIKTSVHKKFMSLYEESVEETFDERLK